jgi:hypothetical protein
MDQIHARIGDGSVSAYIRDAVLADIPQPDSTAVHELPPVRSDERMHDLAGHCWCGPLILTVQDQQLVRHNKAA